MEAAPGFCVIQVPFSDGLTQQEQYFHVAVTGDTAGGYAALTLAPAGGDEPVTRGEVVSVGRRLFA